MPSDLPHINGREVYECANQLEGYVDSGTPERLAQFLLREGKAAADLADRIVALEAWKAEAMEVLRPFADAAFPGDGNGVFEIPDGHPIKFNLDLSVAITHGDLRAARSLVEKEDGRHG